MCGLFGLALTNSHLLSSTFMEDINELLTHRGPDGFGVVSIQNAEDRRALRVQYNTINDMKTMVMLLHRRLAILDLRDIATQPFVDTNAGLAVLVNGEIYNFRALRNELTNCGHVFNTRSDSEVIFHGYREWGKDIISRLEGMFSCAILDAKTDTLLLARDRFGIKPLFIAHTDSGLCFSSELPPIRRAMRELGTAETINSQAYYDFLRHGLTEFDDVSLFNGISSLTPGHLMRYDLRTQALQTICYHQEVDTLLNCSYEDAVEQTRNLFISAVERHMAADVPVATTLSGGIDSSAILSVMARKLKIKPHAFTFVSADVEQSEESWAERAAEGLEVDLQKVIIEPPSFDHILDVIQHQGEPFDGSSIIAQNAVHQAVAAQGYKVVLDGQGADELLAGYMPHVGWHIGDMAMRRHIGEAIATGYSFWQHKAPMSLIGVGAIDRVAPVLVSQWLRAMRGADAFPAYLNRAWFTERGVRTLFNRRTSFLDQPTLRARLNYALRRESIPHLLRYADRNAMMHSIENRVPFLDYPFVDFVSRLPSEYCVSRDGRTKAVFRDAMRGLVNESILERRDKVGFAAPAKIWYKEHKERFSEVIFDQQTISRMPGVNWPVIEKAFKEGKLSDKIFWRLFNIAIIGS